jgi:hypothetical protein
LEEVSSEAESTEKLIVKKKAEADLEGSGLLEGSDDYDGSEEELLDEDRGEPEDEVEQFGAEAVKDGQHGAEDRFFLGTLAKLFRGQASSPSKEMEQ